MRSDQHINRDGSADQGYHHIIGVAQGKSTSNSITYANGYRSPSAITVQAAESTITALRYHEPTTSLAAQEAVPTVTFTSSAQSLIESSTPMTITAQLSEALTQDVSIPFTVGGSASDTVDYTITASPVTISAGNLTAAITIDVIDDVIHESDETVVVTMGTPTNVAKGAITAHTATIRDDEPPGISITESGGATDVVEGGATDTYTIVLLSQPTADVTVTIATDGQAGTSSASLTFTNANWDTAQTVTVTAVNDSVAEGAHSSTITHTAASADGDYDGITIADVIVNITDNDTAGVTNAESGGSTDIVEGGATDTYTVVLDTEPTADVTVTVSSDSESTVNPTSLTFTSGNWSTPQTITVTAVNDDIAEGNHTSTVSHTAASADGNYNGIGIADVTANITDNDTAGVSVTESGGSTDTAEGGAPDAYTVVLTSEPVGDVTVTVTPDGQVSVDSSSITFTPADWDTPQTVTVTAVDDAVAEGNHTGAIVHTATSADTSYDGVGVAGVTANITDNDTAGVTITESGGSTDVAEGGATDTYTIVLTSEPTANVVVTVAPDAQLSVNPASLTFTAANWSVAQTVTVTAVNDAVAEGAHTGGIGHTAASADGNYDGIGIGGVTANITDNDSAGVTVVESGGATNVVEGGATDTYTVVLTSSPTADVDVSINTGGQTIANPPSLTFTSANWSTPQTVTVTALDDEIAEGNHTGSITNTAASADGNYDGIGIAGVTANITDNDNASVTITESGGSTNVTEGGATDTYTVVLTSEPIDIVTVTVTPDSQVSVGGGAGTPITAMFDASNWDVPQTVTVTADNDTVAEGNHTGAISHSAASMDANYDGIAVSGVTAHITDNDEAIANFSLAAQSLIESGGAMTVTVQLSIISALDVTIPFTVGGTATDPDDYTITASPLTIAAGDTTATITITINDDAIHENDETVVITMGDPTNATKGPFTAHTATIRDDEPPGVSLAETAGATAATEGGADDTYTIVLLSQPTADVVVTLATDGETSVNPGSLTFTDANWDTPQTVTVTAVDDDIAEGLHASTVTHTATSADGDYNGIAISDITVSITDNDTAGVTVTESGGTTDVIEGGATDTYTLVLTSEPTADVTVTITPDSKTTVNPTSLTFTSGNWDTPQTVTVTAVDDNIANGNYNGTISHTAASTDAYYDGIAVDDVTANITDDDVAGVTITESDGTTDVVEGGATDTYTVVLTSQPKAAVTITIDPDDQSDVGGGAGNVVTLSFTAAQLERRPDGHGNRVQR